jgi:hypothetical protein
MVSVTKEQKTEFARFWLALGNPFQAALQVCGDPSNTGLALQLQQDLVNDEFVKSEKVRLLNGKDAVDLLPSKEKQAKDIYDLATNQNIAVEDRLKAHRLYAELRSFIEKPAQGGNTTNILNKGVMIVKDHGTEDEWESKVMRQQASLTAPTVIDANVIN